MKELTWVEVSESALRNNIAVFRKLIGPDIIMCPAVKANAYGHGLVNAAKVFLDSGADWLAVDALHEAEALRAAGIAEPIYVMGYVMISDLKKIADLNLRLVVYNEETLHELGEVVSEDVRIHFKVETGNNRQGRGLTGLKELFEVASQYKNIEVEGLATHFANIEDTVDHSYAEAQLNRFEGIIEELKADGYEVPIKHCANSAAALLFDKTYFNMVRPGIACYGMWPSNETYESYLEQGNEGADLVPAFTWKTRIAQLKEVDAGEYIGYGCTYRTTHKTKLAILPVGYYDGYDRGISGGHVLIGGERAPIRGRICMNIMMVEVTDIPGLNVEDEVVLIGSSGSENISAEQFANWAGTINYEIPTRVNDRTPRFMV